MFLEDVGQRRLPEGVCCDWMALLWARSRMMRLSFLKTESRGTVEQYRWFYPAGPGCYLTYLQSKNLFLK